MKKLGFTLAEAMVALALIGVIASLTIPTFISSNRNRASAVKLASVISSVENALSSMIAVEAVQDLSETTFGGSPTAANLGKYIHLAGSETTLKSYYSTDTPFKTLNNTASNPSVTRIFQTQNGALLIYYSNSVSRDSATVAGLGGSVTDSLGYLTIDTNGIAKPNVWGRDVFYFRISNDGKLQPAGSLNFSILEEGDGDNVWDASGTKWGCEGKVKNQGCTARLISNNYEIDY